MALRIRRGLDIERQSIIPAEGEPLYCTDTGMLYIGDGSSVGGQLVTGIKSLLDDPAPALAAPLDLNSHAIVGMGDINIVGDLTVSGNLNIDAVLSDYRGSLYGNDSTLIIDGNNHLVYASVTSLAGDLLVDVNTGKINLEYSKLQSLQDVDGTLPLVGSTLTWDGTQWIPSVFGSNAGHMPDQGAILQYDTTAGWNESTFVTANDSTPMFNLQTGEFFLGQTNLDSIGNVYIDMNTLQSDHVLTWDGINWTHKEITIDNVQFLGIDLDSLQNVYTPNPAANDILQWDGNMWTNVSSPLLGIDLDSLQNVYTPNPDINDVLQWDGNRWIHASIDLDSLRNVYTPNPAVNDVLQWDGIQWTNVSNPQEAVKIDYLENVFLNAQAYGDVLTFDGANWVNSSIPDTEINDLTDVSINLPETGDTLVWSGSHWENITPVEVLTEINDLTDVSINLVETGDLLTWSGSHWENIRPNDFFDATVDRDYSGSFQGTVYGLDSTVIVDGATNSITSDSITSEQVGTGKIIVTNDELEIIPLDTTPFPVIKYNTNSTIGTIQIVRNETAVIDPNEDIFIGQVSAWIDDPNGKIVKSLILFTTQGLYLFAGPLDKNTGRHPESAVLTNREGKVGIGTYTPAETLTTIGNISATEYIKFGSYTTAERDNLTTTNNPQHATDYGMIIYNTTTNTFQGWANVNGTTPTWVNLS